MPQEGETLRIGDIHAIEGVSPRLRNVVKRLAEEKAPETVAQLVLWHLGYGIDWPTLEHLASAWANRNEVALAKQFVNRQQGTGAEDRIAESGTIYYDLSAAAPEGERLGSEMCKLMDGRSLLGLTARLGAPAQPQGPALAVRIEIKSAEAKVRVSSSDEAGSSWVEMAKFSLPLLSSGGTASAPTEVVDRIAEGLLHRLIRARLTRAGKGSKDAPQIRVENASPLVLNGLILAGQETKPDSNPPTLIGLSLSPRKAMTLPASHELVRRLGLKKGIRVLAADLSGL
jgi:hypothetical protein